MGMTLSRAASFDPAVIQEPVERLSLAADGSLLASAGHDGRVRVWSTRWLTDGDDADSAQAEDDGNDAEEVRCHRLLYIWAGADGRFEGSLVPGLAMT